MKRILVVALGLVLVGVLAGCSSGSSAPAVTLEMKAANMAFSDKEIAVTKGQVTKLVLNNQDSVEHDWAIAKIPVKVETHGSESHNKKADLHIHAEAGKTESVTFTAKEAGAYEFACTVPGHKDAGMVGKLIVK